MHPYVPSTAGVPLHVDPTDPRALNIFVAGGAIDHDLVHLWRLLIWAIRPDVVIDVGANYGEILFCANYEDSCELIAVEPNPAICARLKQTAAHSPHRVAVHEVAASDAPGTAILRVPPTSSGLGSLRRHFNDSENIEVYRQRLDDLLRIRPGSRLLAKIDVEGDEVRVLAGMSRIIDGSAIAAVVCEVSPDNISGLRAYVETLNLELLAFHRRSLSIVHQSAPLETISQDTRSHPFLRDVVILAGDSRNRSAVRSTLVSLVERFGPRERRSRTLYP